MLEETENERAHVRKNTMWVSQKRYDVSLIILVQNLSMSRVLQQGTDKGARTESGITNEREREGGPTLEPAIVRSHS